MPSDAPLTDLHDADRESLDELNVARLQDLARRRDVPGRSRMTKPQLVEALLEAQDGDPSTAAHEARGRRPGHR